MAELTFDGFRPAAFAYFEALSENNEKGWFEANRATFDAAVKAPMTALMEGAAATFGGRLKMSRPHRDVRFSRDKSPYKLNIFGFLHSREGTDAGLYASLSAEGLYVGTGYYEMADDQVARYRAALDDDGKARTLRDLMEAARATLDVRGRALKTAPRGMRRDHPHIELIRMKEIVAGVQIPPEACGTAAVRDRVYRVWRDAEGLVGWLDRHVGPSELSPEERWGRG